MRPGYLFVLFLLLLTRSGVNGQDGTIDFVETYPLDEAYWETIDDWGWQQYYNERWDSLETVFSIVLERTATAPGISQLHRKLNLLARLRLGYARARRGFVLEGVRMMEVALREGETYFGPILEWGFHYVALGDVYELVGNLQRSFSMHEQAARLVTAAVPPGDPNFFLNGNKETNLAGIFLERGQLGEARIHLERSIAAFRRAGKDGLLRIHSAYSEYAIVLARLGRFDQAEETLDLLEAIPAPHHVGWINAWARAWVETHRGDDRAALLAYRRAVSFGLPHIQPQHPFPTYRPEWFFRIRRDFLSFLLDRGAYEEAGALIASTRKIAEALGQTDHTVYREIRLLEVRWQLQSGDLDAARAACDRLLPEPRTVGTHNNSPFLAATLDVAARIRFERHRAGAGDADPAGILEYCDLGQRIIGEILLTHSAEFQYSDLLERHRALYDLPVRLAYESFRTLDSPASRQALFEAMERTRHLDFSTQLRQRYEQLTAAPELRELIGEKLLLSAQQRELEQQLSRRSDRELTAKTVAEMRIALRNAVRKAGQLEERTAAGYPEYAALGRRRRTACTLDELQSCLSDGEAVLIYHLDERSLTLATITAHTFSATSRPLADLPAQLAAFTDSVVHPGAIGPTVPSGWPSLAYHLYRTLVGAGDLPGEVTELILLPDGALHQLPWNALLTELDPAGEQWRNQPFLLRRYALTTEVSATTLFLERRFTTRREHAGSYVGMAPTYPERPDYRFADFRGEAMAAALPGVLRQRGGTLRFNREEVRAVSAHYRGAKVFYGEEATERNLKHWAPGARYLHLAAHGFADPEQPSYTHLALTPGGAGEEDNLLYTDEIYNLPLTAELVVLSACDSGAGRFRNGSGVQSLARAFRAAGSREVMMSRWPVEDRTTYRLVTNFFSCLPEERRPATALRRATLTHLTTEKQEILTHPYYWAGFSLLGPGGDRPTLPVSARWSWIILLPLVGCFLLGCFLPVQLRK